MSANRQGTPRRAPVATLPAHGAACPGEDNHSRFHGSLIPGYDASSKRALLTSKNTLSFALNLSNEPRPLHNAQERTREELLESLTITLREALEMNRHDAMAQVGNCEIVGVPL